MTNYVKMASVLVLLLLASPVVLVIKGCGNTMTGGASGACPDSVAPDGATITPPSNLGPPSTTMAVCYPTLPFIVRDSQGNAMNGICVQVFSSANIAIQSSVTPCGNVSVSPSSSIVTRTDAHGIVMVEMLTPTTTTGNTFFVEAVSGAAIGLATTAGAI